MTKILEDAAFQLVLSMVPLVVRHVEKFKIFNKNIVISIAFENPQ